MPTGVHKIPKFISLNTSPMKLIPHQVYHVYNRGINRQLLFYEKENYPYFLAKVKKYIAPFCDLLAYCLMPNHFHFLIHANSETNIPFLTPHFEDPEIESMLQTEPSLTNMTCFSHGLKMLLSSYAKAINKQHKRTGSLFTQNTRCKRTSSEAHLMDYTLWCFIYIHNNPCTAGLVQHPDQWMYSSYREYLGKTTDPVCNLELGRKLLDLEMNELVAFTDCKIPDQIIAKIF